MRVFYVFCWMLLCHTAIGQSEWKLKNSSENIHIYTRDVPNKKYKEFRATILIPANMENILNILNDTNGFNQWFAYSKKVKLLEDDGDNKLIYMETKFPWPFQNEDMVYLITQTRVSKGETQYQFMGKPENLKYKPRINQMKSAKGYFLIQNKNDSTLVIFTMQTELSGAIPPWLANQHIHRMPFKTLTNLHNMVIDDRD